MSNINFANYGYNVPPFPTGLGSTTSVGTNGSPSYFGTYDQTGNVSEHIEAIVLISSSDSYTPSTTPTGTDVFISAVKKPTNFDSSFPQQYITPVPDSENNNNIRPALTPIPIPSTQNFSYGNSNRGGSFVSSTGNMNSTQNLSFSLPTSPSKDVGFRLAATSKIYTLTGVHITASGDTAVYVPSGQMGEMYSASSEPNIQIGMNVSGSPIIAEGATVSHLTKGLGSTFSSLTPGVVYERFRTTLAASNSGNDLTIEVSMDNPLNMKHMVLVDASGNNPDGFSPGYGRVNYNYYIGKYPVTNSEYSAYLNIVARKDDQSVYYTPGKSADELNMSDGISKLGNTYFRYRVNKFQEDKPVVGITWMQAARYCNWLHRRVTSANTITTDNGAYDLSNPLQSQSRSNDARYFIPNLHEWYKAAYYGKAGGIHTYTDYATRSNSPPQQIASADVYGDGPYRNLTDLSLFDRFSFDDIGDLRWIKIINSAADRWDRYLSHIQYSKIIDADYYEGYRYEVNNKSRYDALRSFFMDKYNISWKGLHLSAFSFVYSTADFLAEAIPYDPALTTGNGVSARVLPTTFKVIINSRYNDSYSDKDWISIMAHELGHALGFGTYWDKIDQTGTLTPIASNYFLDRNPFEHTNIEYNKIAYGETGGYTRKFTPIEQSGGAGVAARHWEDNYLTDGECFTPLNCSVDTPYVGIKDLMNSTYRKDTFISNITIANMVDLGYYSKDGTMNGEGNFKPVYSGIDPNLA